MSAGRSAGKPDAWKNAHGCFADNRPGRLHEPKRGGVDDLGTLLDPALSRSSTACYCRRHAVLWRSRDRTYGDPSQMRSFAREPQSSLGHWSAGVHLRHMHDDGAAATAWAPQVMAAGLAAGDAEGDASSRGSQRRGLPRRGGLDAARAMQRWRRGGGRLRMDQVGLGAGAVVGGPGWRRCEATPSVATWPAGTRPRAGERGAGRSSFS